MNVKTNNSTILNYFLLSIAIFILTFPKTDPTFTPGLDSPLTWLYNYLFISDFSITKYIIFPYGPLAFLKYSEATGNNLLLSLICYSVLKISMILIIFYYGFITNKNRWLIHFVITLILSLMLIMDYFIISIVIFSLLIYNENKNRIWLIVATALAVLGFFIKSSIGNLSVAFYISFLILNYIQYHNFKKIITYSSILITVYVIFWLILYRSFYNFFNYLYGNLILSREFGNAMSLYPANNWIILFICLIIICIIPITIKEQKTNYVYLLFIVPLFAAWKHGITREDCQHIRAILIMLIIFYSTLVICIEQIKPKHIFLITSVILLFFYSTKNSLNYFPYSINVFGSDNFYETVFNYKKLYKNSEEVIRQNIETKKLNNKQKDLIGAQSVDIYPWDYSFIPANKLNLIPRPIPQIYSSYSPWLDNLNAEHFQSDIAPKFIIWEFFKDKYGYMGDIDDKYMLNNEPLTLNIILNEYTLKDKNDNILLFEKTNINPQFHPEIQVLLTEQKEWNEWIEVPKYNEGILRLKLKLHSGFLRYLKSLLYKDNEFFIEYKLENNFVLRYRFVPNNAENGIWINPLIIDLSDEYYDPPVKQVKFTSLEPYLMKPIIDLTWENINKNKNASKLFGKNKAIERVYSGSNNFKDINTVNYRRELIIDKKSNITYNPILLNKNNNFTPVIEIPVKNISSSLDNNLIVYATAHVNSNINNSAKLVISVVKQGKTLYWTDTNLKDFIIEDKTWYFAKLKQIINDKLSGDEIINAYIRDDKGEDIYVDEVTVNVYKIH